MTIDDVYHMVRKLEDTVNQCENDIASLQGDNGDLLIQIANLESRIDELEDKQ